jgi:hypothetical protein
LIELKFVTVFSADVAGAKGRIGAVPIKILISNALTSTSFQIYAGVDKLPPV